MAGGVSPGGTPTGSVVNRAVARICQLDGGSGGAVRAVASYSSAATAVSGSDPHAAPPGPTPDSGPPDLIAFTTTIDKDGETVIDGGAQAFLDTNLVSEAIAHGLAATQASTGLPWWVVIGMFTITIRTALVPATLHSLRANRRIQAALPHVRSLYGRLNAASSNDIPAAKRLSEFWRGTQRILGAARTSVGAPFLSPAIHLPVFWSASLAIRAMARDDFGGLSQGGALWFPDLTAADPLYVLPVVHVSLFLVLMETSMRSGGGGDGSGGDGNDGAPRVLTYVKRGLQGGALLLFPYFSTLPAGVLLYWATSLTYSLVQSTAIRTAAVQDYITRTEQAAARSLAASGSLESTPAAEGSQGSARLEISDAHQAALVAAHRVLAAFGDEKPSPALVDRINARLHAAWTTGEVPGPPLRAMLEADPVSGASTVAVAAVPADVDREALAKEAYLRYAADLERVGLLVQSFRADNAMSDVDETARAAINDLLERELGAGRISHRFRMVGDAIVVVGKDGEGGVAESLSDSRP